MLHCPSSATPELDARLVLSAPPTFIILHEVSSLVTNPELEFVVPSTIYKDRADRLEGRLALII